MVMETTLHSIHPMILTNFPFSLDTNIFWFQWIFALTRLCIVCTSFPLFAIQYNMFFILTFGFELQPQTWAPIPHVKPNLTNHHALKKTLKNRKNY